MHQNWARPYAMSARTEFSATHKVSNQEKFHHFIQVGTVRVRHVEVNIG